MAGGAAGKSGPRAQKSLPNPRSEVVRLAERRESLKRDLEQLERQIADYEASYLKSSPYGNAIKGWRSTTAAAGDAASSITDKDRIFSLSSISWRKTRKLESAGEADAEMDADADEEGDGKAGAARPAASGRGRGRGSARGGRGGMRSKSKDKDVSGPEDEDDEDQDNDEDEDDGAPARRTTRSRKT